jgi:hypothetical protein
MKSQQARRPTSGGAPRCSERAARSPASIPPHHYPRTVVTNPDDGDPAAFYLHLHARRPRVERVLDELFHRRGRALYHLACGDTMGYLRRQDAYSASIVVGACLSEAGAGRASPKPSGLYLSGRVLEKNTEAFGERGGTQPVVQAYEALVLRVSITPL